MAAKRHSQSSKRCGNVRVIGPSQVLNAKKVIVSELIASKHRTAGEVIVNDLSAVAIRLAQLVSTESKDASIPFYHFDPKHLQSVTESLCQSLCQRRYQYPKIREAFVQKAYQSTQS